MKPNHDPLQHSTGAPDLRPEDGPLAALLAESLLGDGGQAEAQEFRARVLGSAPALRARMIVISRGAPLSSSRASPSRAMGGWAVAAGLLIAIGLGGFFLLHGAGSATSGVQQVAVEPMNAGIAPRRDIVLREDSALSLFHDIETFGSLGVDPDDLLALGE